MRKAAQFKSGKGKGVHFKEVETRKDVNYNEGDMGKGVL